MSHSLVEKQDIFGLVYYLPNLAFGFLCFLDFLLKPNRKFRENLDLGFYLETVLAHIFPSSMKPCERIHYYLPYF